MKLKNYILSLCLSWTPTSLVFIKTEFCTFVQIWKGTPSSWECRLTFVPLCKTGGGPVNVNKHGTHQQNICSVSYPFLVNVGTYLGLCWNSLTVDNSHISSNSHSLRCQLVKACSQNKLKADPNMQQDGVPCSMKYGCLSFWFPGIRVILLKTGQNGNTEGNNSKVWFFFMLLFGNKSLISLVYINIRHKLTWWQELGYLCIMLCHRLASRTLQKTPEIHEQSAQWPVWLSFFILQYCQFLPPPPPPLLFFFTFLPL